MIWNLRGTAAQNDLVNRALAACDFPFELLTPSLQSEGKATIGVEWADLSSHGAAAKAAGDGHDHDHGDGGAHTIVRDVGGRSRVLGLFYLPPHTRIVLDVNLERHPQLAAEVFLAEAAHAVDLHYLNVGQRRAIWDALHQGQPASSAHDQEHGWFETPFAQWTGGPD